LYVADLVCPSRQERCAARSQGDADCLTVVSKTRRCCHRPGSLRDFGRRLAGQPQGRCFALAPYIFEKTVVPGWDGFVTKLSSELTRHTWHLWFAWCWRVLLYGQRHCPWSSTKTGSTEGVIRALQDDSSEAKVDLQDALAAALEAGDYQAAVNAASPLTAKKTAEAAAAHLRGLGGDRLTGQGDDDPVFLPLVSAFAWPPAPPAPPTPSLQPIKVPSLATTSVLCVVGFRTAVRMLVLVPMGIMSHKKIIAKKNSKFKTFARCVVAYCEVRCRKNRAVCVRGAVLRSAWRVLF
jgi:hypothetical protein